MSNDRNNRITLRYEKNSYTKRLIDECRDNHIRINKKLEEIISSYYEKEQAKND